MILPSLLCPVQVCVDGWVNPDNGMGFGDVVHDVNGTIFKDPSHINAKSSSYEIVPSSKPLQNEAKPRRVGTLGNLLPGRDGESQAPHWMDERRGDGTVLTNSLW